MFTSKTTTQNIKNLATTHNNNNNNNNNNNTQVVERRGAIASEALANRDRLSQLARNS